MHRFPCLLFAVLLPSLAALPAAADGLRVGLTEFPPYSTIAPDGTVEGPLPDLLRSAFARARADLELPVRPIARLKAEFQDGKVDCRLASADDPPHPDLVYGHEPVYTLRLAVWARAADLDRLPSDDLRRLALRDVRWGLVHGLSYTDELNGLIAGNEVLSTYDDATNLRGLLADRIDITVADVDAFVALANREGLSDAVARLGDRTFEKSYFLACRRDASTVDGGTAILLAAVDRALASLRPQTADTAAFQQ